MADFDDLSLRGQILRQRRRPGPRETVGSPAIFARQRLDETVALKSRERFVQGAGLELDAGKLGNIFHQRISMFLAVSETREDERRDSRIFTETV